MLELCIAVEPTSFAEEDVEQTLRDALALAGKLDCYVTVNFIIHWVQVSPQDTLDDLLATYHTNKKAALEKGGMGSQ